MGERSGDEVAAKHDTQNQLAANAEARDFTEKVLTTVPPGIFVIADSGEVVQTNEHFRRKLGIDDATEPFSLSDLTLLDETGNAVPSAKLPHRIVFETGAEVSAWQCLVELPPGDRLWVSLDAVPVFGGGNVVEYVVVAVREITQLRNEAERLERQRDELQRELERYETIVETVPDGAYVLDEDFHFQFVNEAYATMVGYSRDALIGSHVSKVTSRQAIEKSTALREELLAGDRSIAIIEQDLQTADGGTIPVETRSQLLPFEDHFRGTSGVSRDITERLERERALTFRARQQAAISDLGQYALQNPELDRLFDEAASVVADVLDNGYSMVLDFDAETEELLLRQGVGWRDGFVGRTTLSAETVNSQSSYTLHAEEPVVVTDLEAETRFSGSYLLTTHEVTSGISTIIASDDGPWGILGTHDTRETSFTDEDVAFVQSVANILAEAIEREQYQQDLEGLVDDLEASNDRLEQSNERLEQFAYAASHDLQEPLRMISSYLQLIENRYGDALDEDGTEFLDYAVDDADRMREMIEGLLTYSRVESRSASFESVALDEVFTDALADLQMKIEEHDAEITADSLPHVSGDERQLCQLFQNVLDNAIEYSGNSTPRVHVSAERTGETWAVSVRDEGIGIDMEDQTRIFELFKRLHAQNDHPGTGLGLALCERIVERHGGEIWVESEPGIGSTFSFTLPATDS